MLFIQCDHGSTLYSKERKMGYQDTRHTRILSNQIQGCQLNLFFGMFKGRLILLKRVDIPLHS